MAVTNHLTLRQINCRRGAWIALLTASCVFLTASGRQTARPAPDRHQPPSVGSPRQQTGPKQAYAECPEVRRIGQFGGSLGAIAPSPYGVTVGVGPRVVSLVPGGDSLRVEAISEPVDGLVEGIAVDEDGVAFVGVDGRTTDALVVMATTAGRIGAVRDYALRMDPYEVALLESSPGAAERRLAVAGYCDEADYRGWCVKLIKVAGDRLDVDDAETFEFDWLVGFDAFDDYFAVLEETEDAAGFATRSVFLWSLREGPVRVGLGRGYEGEGVVADADRVYLLGSDQFVDMARPSEPRVLRLPRLLPTEAADVSGGILYFVTEGLNAGASIGAMDIRDPDDWKFLGGATADVGPFAGLLVAGDGLVAVGGDGVALVDSKDPANLSTLGTWTVPGSARALAVDGDFTYIVDGTERLWVQTGLEAHTGKGNGLTRSDPIRTDVIGGGFGAVAVDDGVAVLVDRGISPATLFTLDLSEPLHPRPAGSWNPLPEMFSVAIERHFAYVGNRLGLHVVDVHDPAVPLPRFIAGAAELRRSVAVDAGVLAVAQPEDLELFDVTDPAAPEPRGALPGSFVDVALRNDTAFATADEAPAHGLHIVDLSDPWRPRITAGLHFENAGPVAVFGPWVLVGDGSVLRLVDASDPVSPQLVLDITLPADITDIAAEGSRFSVADGPGGVFVFGWGCPGAYLPSATRP